ncbi:hypothetical protein V8E36_006485 [Tilletia maclaganii]
MVMEQSDADKVVATCFASATNIADFLLSGQNETAGSSNSNVQSSSASTSISPSSPAPSPVTAYIVTIWRINSETTRSSSLASASCQCRDWQNAGGACKHIRAVLLSLPPYAQDLQLPATEKEAIYLSHSSANLLSSLPTSGGDGRQPHVTDFDKTLDLSLPQDLLSLIDWDDPERGTAETGEEEEGEENDDDLDERWMMVESEAAEVGSEMDTGAEVS